MARLNWCLAAVISWGKFLFSCFFPLRGANKDKVSPHNEGDWEGVGEGSWEGVGKGDWEGVGEGVGEGDWEGVGEGSWEGVGKGEKTEQVQWNHGTTFLILLFTLYFVWFFIYCFSLRSEPVTREIPGEMRRAGV